MRDTLDGRPHVEYLDGVAYPKVSPKLTHSLVQGAMCRILYRAAGKRGKVGPELDVHPASASLGQTKFVPDVAYVSNERLKTLSQSDREAPPFSPDIAVEVWSPSNDRRYLERKIERYVATGSVLVLDVDPYARTIAAHDGTSVRVYHSGETFQHPGVTWLRFAVAEAFEDLSS